MPASTIEHSADLPWGWWMRTVSNPQGDIVIVDEKGRQWQSLREAFWCGRLGMSRHHQHVVDENLELMLALLASRSRGIVPHIENVHTLFGESDRFYRWWTYWMMSIGLIGNGHSTDPFGVGATAEGASVIRMLLATRPPELAAVPIGPLAMKVFGPPGSDDESSRMRFDAAEGKARSLTFGMARERLFGRPAISLLHRDLDDAIPFARTIWSLSFLDEASRDRMYMWMHDRLDRWTAWGELARHKGADALTQHLLALTMLSDTVRQPAPERSASTSRLAITDGR